MRKRTAGRGILIAYLATVAIDQTILMIALIDHHEARYDDHIFGTPDWPVLERDTHLYLAMIGSAFFCLGAAMMLGFGRRWLSLRIRTIVGWVGYLGWLITDLASPV